MPSFLRNGVSALYTRCPISISEREDEGEHLLSPDCQEDRIGKAPHQSQLSQRSNGGTQQAASGGLGRWWIQC